MSSYLRLYDNDVSYSIENGWKFSFQTVKDGILEPKPFNDWNEEELCESEQNYIGLYAILRVASTNQGEF